MKKIIYSFLTFILLSTLVSCNENEPKHHRDYEDTKKMVVDLLKTDEGKKAIQELMKEEEMKQALIIDHAYVKETIQKTLTSEEGKKFWKEVMSEPKFAETFAKTIQSENEQILKRLMKDPEYQ